MTAGQCCGRSEEVAVIVAYFAGPEAAFVTVSVSI
jgi:hypothetical protein